MSSYFLVILGALALISLPVVISVLVHKNRVLRKRSNLAKTEKKQNNAAQKEKESLKNMPVQQFVEAEEKKTLASPPVRQVSEKTQKVTAEKSVSPTINKMKSRFGYVLSYTLENGAKNVESNQSDDLITFKKDTDYVLASMKRFKTLKYLSVSIKVDDEKTSKVFQVTNNAWQEKLDYFVKDAMEVAKEQVVSEISSI